jgi:8-oxo-dGTP pyrophosphatase MutT (NUDIX family)
VRRSDARSAGDGDRAAPVRRSDARSAGDGHRTAPVEDAAWRDGLLEDGDEPVVRLRPWSGPWPGDDPDANLKVDVAAYSQTDPLATLTNLARSIDVPVGALVRYVLARWASGGSEGLLELGPSTVERMRAEVQRAEDTASDAARLQAYEVLRQQVSWLAHGLDHPEQSYPNGGAGPARRLRLAAYGLACTDDHLLLTRLADGRPDAGSWTLPGGGLDHGEDPRDGARREIREETGLEASIGEILDVLSWRLGPEASARDDDLHSVQLIFRAEVPTDRRPQVLDVVGTTAEARWVHVDELGSLKLVALARHGAHLAGFA